MECGLHRLVLLEGIEVFEEQEPRGLLGVVQLARGARILVQDVVDVLERLLEQGCPCLSSSSTLETEPSRQRLADYARREPQISMTFTRSGYSLVRKWPALSSKIVPDWIYRLTIASLRWRVVFMIMRSVAPAFATEVASPARRLCPETVAGWLARRGTTTIGTAAPGASAATEMTREFGGGTPPSQPAASPTPCGPTDPENQVPTSAGRPSCVARSRLTTVVRSAVLYQLRPRPRPGNVKRAIIRR
jgi:hypothetical protein